MNKESFKESFLNLCKDKKFEINSKQLEVIELLIKFISSKKKFLNFFKKNNDKKCFYLYGDVGVGKTMIINHLYNFLKIPKKRFHFNRFMIEFHDFRHLNKKNSITTFVKKLKKKINLIYLDEFQVTNIVDAMILGKLFETIISQNIKVLITSNTGIEKLYKDGLQRNQFLPFITFLKKNSIQKELIINEDYRKSKNRRLKRLFFPLNESTNFRINQLFRELTKGKVLKKKTLMIKGRKFEITEFYDGIAKFDFINLCGVNVGSEDYIKIAENCKFIVIVNIPNFNDLNSNFQQRFITLIDILYEKKIPLMMSIDSNLENINSSVNLVKPFKRTLSRLFELTSSKNNYLNTVV